MPDEAIRTFSLPPQTSRTSLFGRVYSRILRRCLGAYLIQIRRIWNHLSISSHRNLLVNSFGRHLHSIVRLQAERKQYFATYFLRNRAELELMRRLVDGCPHGSSLEISVLACSKGAEVYSILYAIRSARPDLRLRTRAVDISQEIVDFADRGVYSLDRLDDLQRLSQVAVTREGDLSWNTGRDQQTSIFERVTDDEMRAMFDVEGNEARIKPWLKEGITWMQEDAGDPELAAALGPQDIVVANRFLCHMPRVSAEKTLRNLARLVKPGGYLFVSGIDLEVRTKVAQERDWKPVTDLMREIHEGDVSIRRGWPLEYWGLEPFCDNRPDWRMRYASVFQIGEPR
jgi:chemotaxis methyl-accepting protein methylase